MLAHRIVGLLPELDPDDALALAAIRSVAGRLPADGLSRTPPLVAPHHSTSMAALIGGGSGLAKPGAVSLAHGGVLRLGVEAWLSLIALMLMNCRLARAPAAADPVAFKKTTRASELIVGAGSRRTTTCY
jgi:hypothetical protein